MTYVILAVTSRLLSRQPDCLVVMTSAHHKRYVEQASRREASVLVVILVLSGFFVLVATMIRPLQPGHVTWFDIVLVTAWLALVGAPSLSMHHSNHRCLARLSDISLTRSAYRRLSSSASWTEVVRAVTTYRAEADDARLRWMQRASAGTLDPLP